MKASRILDDVAQMAGGAVNIASGLRQQVQQDIQSRVENMAVRLDLVPREDLDQALAMIAALRKQLDDLESRVSTLEPTKKTTKGKKKTS